MASVKTQRGFPGGMEIPGYKLPEGVSSFCQCSECDGYWYEQGEATGDCDCVCHRHKKEPTDG